MSFFGPTLQDLADLWKAEPIWVYTPSTTAPLPPNHLPAQEAKPLHSGAWQCPACGTWYAYWVSKCECQKRNMVTTGNSTNAPLTFTGVKPE